MENPAKILVVGPSWVGDMIMAQSLFMALKVSNPGCQIDVLAPAWSLPLLERMPEVAKGIVMPLKHGEFAFFTRIRLGNQLRSENYTQAIVLPNSWKSALIPFFARIPRRTGFIGESRWGLLNDARKLNKRLLTMTVQRFVALSLEKNAPLPPRFRNPKLTIDLDNQKLTVAKFNLSLNAKVLALCPGAEYGPSKRWPASYFAEVAQLKSQQGWYIWLFGSEKDKEAGEHISQLLRGHCVNLVGLTTLTEALDLISLANTVVANDSGLMHLAAALEKPVIGIYGSTPPGFAPPLSAYAKSVSLNLPCSPCKQRICPLYPAGHPDHTQCLTGIKPEQILELIGD